MSQQNSQPSYSLLLLGAALGVMPFLPRTEYVMVLVGLALLLRGVERAARGEISWRFSLGQAPLALFVAVGVGQALIQGSNSGTWPVLHLWMTALALSLLCVDAVDSIGRAAQVVVPAALGGAVAAGYGLWQAYMGVANEARWTDAASGSWTRIFSVFGNPNIFGTYLALLAPVLLWLWYCDRRRWWCGVLALPILGALALTYSRGAWIACAVGICAALIYLSRRWLYGLIGVALFSAFFLPQKILTRLMSISLNDSSISYRLKVFAGAWRVAESHWLLGVGAGLVSYQEAYTRYMSPGILAVHSHNVFLQVWAERGVVGVVLLLLAFGLFVRDLVRSRAPHLDRVLGLTALATVGGALLQGMVDYVWHDFRNALLFWAVLSVGLGLAKVRDPDPQGNGQTIRGRMKSPKSPPRSDASRVL